MLIETEETKGELGASLKDKRGLKSCLIFFFCIPHTAKKKSAVNKFLPKTQRFISQGLGIPPAHQSDTHTDKHTNRKTDRYHI